MKNLQYIRRSQYEKGFVVPLLIAVIALLVIGGGVYVYENKKAEVPVVTNTEILQPDQVQQQTNIQTPPITSQPTPPTSSQPSITVLSPNGGETIRLGTDPLSVTWRGTNLASNDGIHFSLVSTNGTVTPANAMGTGLDLKATGGSTGLNPGSILSGSYRLKIIDNNGVTDMSDGLFTITSGSITPSSTGIDFSCNPSPVTAKSVPLDVLCGAYGLSVNSTYFIDFGDGSNSGPLTLIAPAHAFGLDGPNNKMIDTSSHTYTSPGNYTISFYKDSTKIDTETISATSPTMVSISPSGKSSPSVQVSSEYASFVSMQILSGTVTADSSFGYIGTVTTAKGAVWNKYIQSKSSGCLVQNYYRTILVNSITQTLLVQFKTCTNSNVPSGMEFIPNDAILRILDTLGWG